MSIPSPTDYKSWQEWGAALVRVMADSNAGVDPATLPARGEVIPPVNLPTIPEGFKPVWLSADETALFMGNSDYDPPVAEDLFQIDTAKLADAAVALIKLQDSSVSTAKILNAAVTVLQLANAAVEAAKIATAAIATVHLQNSVVANAKLADLAVDALKLADLAVAGGKIVDGAVTTTKINDAAVLQAKIGLAAIGAAQIIDLTVGTAALADASIVSVKIGTAAVQTANINTAAITTALVADANILNAKLANAVVTTIKVADAAIVSALIGDAAVVSARIADLAVNTQHVANASITSLKVANASIGAAHILAAAIGTAAIQDAAITNAKIGDTIQSEGWDSDTKTGWLIDKTGFIQGSGIALYDDTGTLIFGSGGELSSTRVAGLGALAALDALGFGSEYLTDFGALAGEDLIDSGMIADGSIVAGDLADAAIVYGSSKLFGFGSLAAISLLTSGNISTYISGAAIGSALIANAAIGTALINTSAITTALIADASIITAKIADAAITSAKIIDLTVSKLTAGTLDAVIDVGTGMLKFSIGGSALYIGRGFGTSTQFIMWFGNAAIAVADCTESNATFYLKTDGSAYFGGSLTSGTLTNKLTSSLQAQEVSQTLGPFTSNGGNRTVNVGYNFYRIGHRPGDLTGADVGLTGTLTLSGSAIGSSSMVGGINILNYDPEHDQTLFRITMAGSFTVTDTSGGLGPISYTVASQRINTSSFDMEDVGSDTVVQTLSIVSIE